MDLVVVFVVVVAFDCCCSQSYFDLDDRDGLVAFLVLLAYCLDDVVEEASSQGVVALDLLHADDS